MTRLLQSIAGLCVAASLAGCCCSPGYVDPCNGVVYGGGWQPCPIPDPFALIFGCGCWGGCGVHGYAHGPAACGDPCCDPCGPTPWVESYGGGAIPAPMMGGYVPDAIPSVPAGVYEEEIHIVPEPTSAAPVSNGTIIFQGHPSGAPRRRVPMNDARNQRWVPARF